MRLGQVGLAIFLLKSTVQFKKGIGMNKIIFLVFLAVAQTVGAETSDVTAAGDTITAKHRYTMGDNDSKSDATTICFLEAKRKAIEYAGVYVESTVEISQTEKSRKAQSDMKTIAAALVSAEMVSSNTGFDNGKVFVDCVVKAKVDKSKLKQEIARITSDPVAKKQVEEQQIRLKNLETEVLRLQAQMQSAPRQEAISLRQERAAVFKEIDTLQQKKLEIISHIESKGKDVLRLITKDMSSREVLSLVGEPRGKDEVDGYSFNRDMAWNYGTHWILFGRSWFVICISTSIHVKNCMK